MTGSPAEERVSLRTWLAQHGWPSALVLGCLSGGLFWASIPRPDFSLVAWVFLIPCLLATAWLPPGQALAAAMAGGVVSGVGRAYWIAPTIHQYGNVPYVPAILTTALLIAYLGAYWIAFFWIYGKLSRPSLLTPWLAGFVWILLEWIQSWLLSGFPWYLVGYTQHANLPLLQVASLTGVYGLGFLVVLVNAAIAQLFSCKLALSRIAGILAPPILLLTVVHLWGSNRLESLQAERGDTLLIGVIQGNVSQDRKWLQDQRKAATAHFSGLARQFPADSLDLIVFPETALPFYLEHPANQEHRAELANLARTLRTPLLVGSLGGTPAEGVFNRAFLFDRSGEVVDYADKVHLVPFGEYLPFPWLFGHLRGLTAESGMFTHGAEHKALRLPGAGVRFGIFICFESVFPAITRTLANLSSSFLVTTTNDAWFGYTAAPRQHFIKAVLRAVETGLPVVRAANTGISGSISAAGEIQQTTGLFQTETFFATVTPRIRTTFYSRHGDLLILLGTVLTGAGWTRKRFQISRQVRRQQEQALSDLERYAATPKPLTRPVILLHGYQKAPEYWLPLVQQLQRCSTNADEMIHVPRLDNTSTRGIRELAAAVAPQLPDGPVDLVGHSMGGLVALELDAMRGARAEHILTLASPFRGTWMARCGRWLRCAGPGQLRDMTPRSAVIRRLQPLLRERCNRLHAWYLHGDPIVPRGSALVPRARHWLYPAPAKAHLLIRHRRMCADVRIIRDIIAVLQGRNGTVDPRTAAEQGV